jgi:hypothetical protein
MSENLYHNDECACVRTNINDHDPTYHGDEPFFVT